MPNLNAFIYGRGRSSVVSRIEQALIISYGGIIMKNLINAIFFALMLAGVSLAQTISAPGSGPQSADKSTKPRIAVIEFTAGPSAAGIGADGTQTLQNGIATGLARTGKFAVADVAKTNITVHNERLTLSGTGISTAAAAKIGKLLGVNYVMTGSVTEYGTTDVGGMARMAIKAQVIDVATGHVKWIAGTRHESAGVTKIGAGTLEMTERVMKPCIQALTSSLKGADL